MINFSRNSLRSKESSLISQIINNHSERTPAHNKPLVTVITPVYNAEKFLKKTVDSVLNQSFGFHKIEYILIDDGSTDSSRKILLEYSSQHENIMVIFLKKNTGTPGQPRNIGIQLAAAEYITFLDADDWLDENGIEILYSILKDTGDDYAVGKTVQIQNKGTKIVGDHESSKERRRISPFSIPHIFHHLGPRGRMVKTSVIRDHHILFPEMKFAEDKQFFIDVLIHARSISTTKAPIYYLNRYADNHERLTNQTNILQKTYCNLKVIKYVQEKKLEEDKEKMILNRLYEFDSINRFFSTPHFQRTRLKFIYHLAFQAVLRTTKKLPYDISSHFHEPINKAMYKLFLSRKYKQLEKLIGWDRQEKIKNIIIKDNLPFLTVPFLKKEPYIRVPMHAIFIKDSFSLNTFNFTFKVYGDYLHTVTDVLIRNSNNALIEGAFPVTVDKSGSGKFELNLQLLNSFPPGSYSIFLRYNEYMKVNFRKHGDEKNSLQFQGRRLTFYKTTYSNLGLKIVDC